MIEFFMGIILGTIFFGGLYLTVQKLNEVRNPNLLMVLSFLFRMAVLLGGLFYLSKRGYQSVLFALLGIIVFRVIMIIIIKNPKEKTTKGSD